MCHEHILISFKTIYGNKYNFSVDVQVEFKLCDNHKITWEIEILNQYAASSAFTFFSH